MKRELRACERFVRSARRRSVFYSMLEGAGIGVAAASGLGAALVIILLIEGKSAWGFVEAALGLGAAVGMIWGLIRRPTELEVAAKADTQLRLHELLGTALLIRRRDEHDAWSGSVVAMADEACARLSPGMLVMNRLGGRAWGGIGISAALLLTLGVMSWLPGVTQGQSNTAKPQAGVELSDEASGAAASARRQEVGEQPNERSGESWEPRTASDTAAARRGSQSSGEARAGEGSAAGRTRDLSADALRASSDGGERAGSERANRAGSGGAEDQTGAVNAQGLGGDVGLNRTGHTLIWQSAEWSRRRKQAAAAVESGRVPDRYKAVIRQYFDQTVD